MSEYQWIVTNVRQDRQWAMDTETKGTIVSGKNRYFTTKNPDLVAEMKAKDPGVLATACEDQRRHGRASFIMPQLPFETEWDRKHKKE